MKIEIYGAEWCAACKQAVSICKSKDVVYDYIDVDDTANLRSLEQRVGNKIRSVPQIFVNGELVANGVAGLRQELDRN